jgi:hypothetical protein
MIAVLFIAAVTAGAVSAIVVSLTARRRDDSPEVRPSMLVHRSPVKRRNH